AGDRGSKRNHIVLRNMRTQLRDAKAAQQAGEEMSAGRPAPAIPPCPYPEPSRYKFCTGCRTWKLFPHLFNRDAATKDGRQNHCMTCNQKYKQSIRRQRSPTPVTGVDAKIGAVRLKR